MVKIDTNKGTFKGCLGFKPYSYLRLQDQISEKVHPVMIVTFPREGPTVPQVLESDLSLTGINGIKYIPPFYSSS